jgi:transcriptional regulator of heat shock response
MNYQPENLKHWATRPGVKTSQFMIDVCDTFDFENYPVFCKDMADMVKKVKEYDEKTMQRIEDVFQIDHKNAFSIFIKMSDWRSKVNRFNDVPVIEVEKEEVPTITIVRDVKVEAVEIDFSVSFEPMTLEQLEKEIREIFIQKKWYANNQQSWFVLGMSSTYKDKSIDVIRMLDKKLLSHVEAETYAGAFAMTLQNLKNGLAWDNR